MTIGLDFTADRDNIDSTDYRFINGLFNESQVSKRVIMMVETSCLRKKLTARLSYSYLCHKHGHNILVAFSYHKNIEATERVYFLDYGCYLRPV